jgi:hypothetical protein
MSQEAWQVGAGLGVGMRYIVTLRILPGDFYRLSVTEP